MDAVARALLNQTVTESARDMGQLPAPPDPSCFGPNEVTLRDSLLSQLRDRAEFYGACQSVAAVGEQNPQGTVLWEFGRLIASVLDREYDVMLAIKAMACATDAAVALDIPATLTEARRAAAC